MSYILDALRKADAERERDPARGIHAQPTAGLPLPAARRAPAWLWPVACAVIAVAAASVWWARAPAGPAARAAIAAVPVGLSTAPAASPGPAAAVMPVVATTVMPPPPAAVERMAEKAVVAPRVAASHAAAPVASVAPAASVAAPVGAAPALAAAAPAAAVPSAAPVAADRIFATSELPPDVQQALPKLAISGGVYSDNPGQRMLIAGGQVMSEGQELAPGVLLEQIRAKSAVLRFRGYRYSVAY